MADEVKKRSLDERLYSLMESLFRELDQDAIHRDVMQLRNENPDAGRRELAKILTRKSAVAASAVGAGAGATGGALGILAMAPDIFNLVRLQSRLILSIAFLYDHKPHLAERFKEVLATLAISTGASAGRQGARYLLKAGLEGELSKKVARRIAGRMIARKLPDIVPFVGGLAGAGLNYLAVNGTGRAAVEYYEHLMKSSQQTRLLEEKSAIEVAAVPAKQPAAELAVRSGRAKVSPRPRASSRKRVTGSSRRTSIASKKKATTKASRGKTGTKKKSVVPRKSRSKSGVRKGPSRSRR